jgi:hypothetical protein
LTPQQVAVLNSLVTFAAENIPGGLSDEEREVAQIVGRMAVTGLPAIKEFDYKVVNVSHYKNTEEAANAMALRGWRVVAALVAKGTGHANQLIVERPVGVTHPDD